MVKKMLFALLMIFMSNLNYSQTTKVFNGPFYNTFTDGNDGTATYNYYEDEHTRNFVKHGVFKYNFQGEGKYKGTIQTITGNFNKGLKNGIWIYKITLTDVGPDDYGTYITLNINLTANYINGYANGNWKETGEVKQRKSRYVNGQKVWEDYTDYKKFEIDFNYLNGNITGGFYINDVDEGQFKAKGKVDNLGFGTETWDISDIKTGEEIQVIFKNKFITELISRNSAGEFNKNSINKEDKYKEFLIAKDLNKQDREEQGLFIDTITGNDNNSVPRMFLKKYIDKLFDRWFLYEEIKGDFSYENKYSLIPKEIRLSKVTYDKLENNRYYLESLKNLEKKEFIKTFINYSKIDTFNLSPSEKKFINSKIINLNPKIDSILKVQTFEKKQNESIIKNLNDSLKISLNKWSENVLIGRKTLDELKTIKKDNIEEFKVILTYENLNQNLVELANEKNNKYENLIRNFEIDILNSKSSIKFNQEKAIIYDIDFKNINNKINSSYQELDSNLKIIDLIYDSYVRIKQIERLNIENEKKVIFKKYKILVNEFNQQLFTLNKENINNKLVTCQKINICLNNIIFLYSDKFKTIEKELKELENTNDIINFLIKIK